MRAFSFAHGVASLEGVSGSGGVAMLGLLVWLPCVLTPGFVPSMLLGNAAEIVLFSFTEIQRCMLVGKLYMFIRSVVSFSRKLHVS